MVKNRTPNPRNIEINYYFNKLSFSLGVDVQIVFLDKASAASALVKNIFSTVDQLEQFPKSGRKLPELKKSRYREIIVGPCRIFYREDQERIYILYVMRSERKLRKYLLETREIENS